MEGREEGIKEGKRAMARQLLAENIPLHIILKCTGFSEEDLIQLKEVYK